MTLIDRHRIHRPLDADADLGKFWYDIVAAWENDSARSQQRGLGPSEIGQCPEYIRAHVSGDYKIPEEGLKTAAFMGRAIGDLLEQVFGERVEAITQHQLTATLPRTQLVITGNADVIVPSRDTILDVKTKDEFATIRKEGASFQNLVQLSAYFIAAVAAGILTKGGLAVLLYVDRSGVEKRFMTASWTYEEALEYLAMAEENLVEVVQVLSKQNALAASGMAPAEVWERTEMDRAMLRNEKPSTCFAIQCGFREQCWGKTAQLPIGKIEDPNAIQAIRNYVDGRELKKDAENLMVTANRELGMLGVEGATEDGWVLSWRNTGRVDPDTQEPAKAISILKR